MPRRDVILPELGIDDQPIIMSLWLVRPGSRVAAGEQILEVLCGSATVDLAAPCDGVLAEVLVAEDEPIRVGQRLAVIEEG